MAKVISFGAAKEVTGSCHLLEIRGIKILIDCGMIQGGDEAANYKPFGFDAKDIDYLVLTHAHIDHIGRVPKLIKEGFNGTIFATAPTFEIAQIMLLDAAIILGEEQKTLLKKAQRKGMAKSVPEPLYTKAHVYQVFAKKLKTLEYKESFSIASFIQLTLYNAGHIMGSSFAHFEYEEDGMKKSVVFSGDLGAKERLIIDAKSKAKGANALFVESTYGDREHRPLDISVEEFKNVINKTLKQKGNVIIPSFALERTQEILWVLKQMFDSGELVECQVFLDSPLAIEATRIYEKYPINLNDDLEYTILQGDSPFTFDWLEMTKKREESAKINEVEEKAIIIAGSGMCTGGRILHHLKNRIWNEKNSIIFVGYQVANTLGRQIIDGESLVNIYGEDIVVKASIYTINGLSAHADSKELLSWIETFENLENIFLIHGEVKNMKIFQEKIKSELDIKTHIVEKKEAIYI